MNPSTAIIIATKGRPQELANLLDALAGQKVHPDVIVVSACDAEDVSIGKLNRENVRVVFGPPGSSVQRNRALSEVRGKCDIVAFFDDDFIPSRFWIERVQTLFSAQPDVGIVTGRVLADGVRVGGIEWPTGKAIVDKVDYSAVGETLSSYKLEDCKSPYGCNMAFRASIIADLKFDERLVLYGWLEDRDFGFRAAAGLRIVSTDFVWGVHLGANRGRTSGLRFGYSQIVNPWYLMKKRTINPSDAFIYIASALSRNAVGAVISDPDIDRWGRLKGNLAGVRDIVLGNWAPERITDL
jgi:GT2 family glycosyltransferase